MALSPKSGTLPSWPVNRTRLAYRRGQFPNPTISFYILYHSLICAGDIAARIYQPGYSGYRGERQKIYLVLEYEYRLSLTSSAIIVRLSAPQENLLLEGSG